jgi:hypothetical protein
VTRVAESLAEIRAAVADANRVRVEDACAALVAALRAGGTVDAGDARELLELLRGHRYFRLLRRVADAFLQNGPRTPTILRHYAQALVEQDELTAARAVLAELEGVADAAERLETAGLLGRVHKQLFVLTGAVAADRRAGHLVAALQAYGEAYRADERRLWHGVNVVALLARAERDGIAVPGPSGVTAASVAERVLELAVADDADPWNLAVAFEAQLALGPPELVEERLRRYLARREVTAFMLGSTLRQLTEVWGLTVDREPGATLLPPLHAALLHEEGGRLTVDLPTVGDAHDAVERRARRLTDAGFHSLNWMTKALQCCRAVALIENELHDGLGTGFLVPGAAFGPGLPEVVLLTNHHVVPGDVDDSRASVRFRGLEAEHDTGARLAWSSPTADLDASLLVLDSPPPGVMPLVPADRMPDIESGGARAFVVGHPEGNLMPYFSLENNAILDVDERRLQYGAGTRDGSSGSPVLDEDWRLIGLHHTGGDDIPRLDGAGTHRANEGSRLDAIVRAYRDEVGPG